MKKTLRTLLIILIIAGGVAYLGVQKGRFKAGEETSTEQTETLNPLANTSWILREFDGQAVNGEYRLDFSDTSVNTQLCNSIGGEYTIADETIQGTFFQTQMACLDEEKSLLESAFDLNGATFTIASTRMVGDNAERLAITTVAGNVFTYSKAGAEEEILNVPQVEDPNLLGGEQTEIDGTNPDEINADDTTLPEGEVEGVPVNVEIVE
ncbi:MAG: META domain-containing protein [Candidatus Peribacteria bacterium]|jgi:heat shock protein HslJ|nr:META domain-containing protein [Candidatus Peribacteria bacterium]